GGRSMLASVLGEDVGEDGAADRDRFLDRDHLSVYVRVLVQPAFRVLGACEEVEHWAAAVAGVGVTIVDAGDDRGGGGPPRGAAVAGEGRVEGPLAEGVAGGGLGRLGGHRRETERVERAHRECLLPIRKPHPVLGRYAGERVGDRDLTVAAEMDKVLTAKRRQRRLELEAEPFGLSAELLPGRPAALGEAAKDPEVERALRVTEARAARLPQLGGRDLRQRQRRRYAFRQARVGVRAHAVAALNAFRIQSASGWPTSPRSLR